MPYGRRQASLRPVVSSKHEIPWSNLSQDASGAQIIPIIRGVQNGAVVANTEVENGTRINGIYFEFQFSAETITSTKIIHWNIVKEPVGVAPSVPSSYQTASRRFVLKRGMEMLPKSVNTIIKRIVFVRLPRGFSRIGENDRIVFQYIATSAEAINACGFAIYKAFS